MCDNNRMTTTLAPATEPQTRYLRRLADQCIAAGVGNGNEIHGQLDRREIDKTAASRLIDTMKRQLADARRKPTPAPQERPGVPAWWPAADTTYATRQALYDGIVAVVTGDPDHDPGNAAEELMVVAEMLFDPIDHAGRLNSLADAYVMAERYGVRI